MLVLARKKAQQIQVGDGITITVLQVRGQVVSIGIDAPRQMKVLRGELAFESATDRGEVGRSTARRDRALCGVP